MRDGPYELLEMVGKGGMGVVYRARCRRTGQIVAVKLMTAERAANPVLIKRFEQEFLTASRLHHPHLVPGLDFGVHEGRPYLVMEFVEGQTLAQRIREQGRLPSDHAVRFLLQIADALHLAHQNQLIHRDVKPHNIILTQEGQARLIDLGLIKDLGTDTRLTWSRTALGTINYMAPEQFDDARFVDARSDVYGLGATLYHAVTGVVPFKGTVNLVIVGKKLRNEFAWPRQLVAGLGLGLDRLIRHCLDADPEQRPQSCAEFMDGLRAAWLEDDTPGLLAPPQESVSRITPLPDEAERRSAPRFAVFLGASCRTLQDCARCWEAEVHDVSLTGVRLALDRGFAPGTMLALNVVGEGPDPIVSLWARVCWVRPDGAGKWVLGCAFTRALSEAELRALLEGTVTTIMVQHEEVSC